MAVVIISLLQNFDTKNIKCTPNFDWLLSRSCLSWRSVTFKSYQLPNDWNSGFPYTLSFWNTYLMIAYTSRVLISSSVCVYIYLTVLYFNDFTLREHLFNDKFSPFFTVSPYWLKYRTMRFTRPHFFTCCFFFQMMSQICCLQVCVLCLFFINLRFSVCLLD